MYEEEVEDSETNHSEYEVEGNEVIEYDGYEEENSETAWIDEEEDSEAAWQQIERPNLLQNFQSSAYMLTQQQHLAPASGHPEQISPSQM